MWSLYGSTFFCPLQNGWRTPFRRNAYLPDRKDIEEDMKYYLIAGEASGDLHASHLMASLRQYDPNAEFRFFGGDNMREVGGTCVRHYKDLAYMGFIPVLLHLRTIMKNMELCKKDIMAWQPDVVIPVDYAGFNLSICKFLSEKRRKGITVPRTFYFIAPKIWAWKEWRIKNFRRDVEEMFCILPFEKDFFEKKHHYPVHYVGNPTADEVRAFKAGYHEEKEVFCRRCGLLEEKPIVAIMAGSRQQEIRSNLPSMLQAAVRKDCQYVIACAPAIPDAMYDEILRGGNVGEGVTVRRVKESTYQLLYHSVAAMVTSGTATLETALFGVPQVVCYKMSLPRITRWAFENIIKCRFISLVNLIADKEVVRELFADQFSVENIVNEIDAIMPGGDRREEILEGYAEIERRLGEHSAPDNAAREMIRLCKGRA